MLWSALCTADARLIENRQNAGVSPAGRIIAAICETSLAEVNSLNNRCREFALFEWRLFKEFEAEKVAGWLVIHQQNLQQRTPGDLLYLSRPKNRQPSRSLAASGGNLLRCIEPRRPGPQQRGHLDAAGFLAAKVMATHSIQCSYCNLEYHRISGTDRLQMLNFKFRQEDQKVFHQTTRLAFNRVDCLQCNLQPSETVMRLVDYQ